MTPTRFPFGQLTTIKRAFCLTTVALCMLATSAVLHAQVMFGSGTTYSAGTGPWGIASGDFNSDGFPDIAVANHGGASPGTFGNGVNILIGKPGGTFENAVSFPGGVGPTVLTTGDFTHDGRIDVATVNTESNSISILPGNGDGTFGAAINFVTGQRPQSITVADFNRDGSPDFAFPVLNGLVSVMLADGNGGFNPIVNYTVPSGSQGIANGDINKDGKLDLVVASGSNKLVSTLLGNGNGTFQSAINSNSGESPSSIVVNDFNRDGKLDVAVAFFAPPSLNIMLGNGTGSFGTPSYSTGSINTPADLKVGDFNGDGRTDLVSTGVFNGANADVFLGKGDGTLNDPSSFGSSPGALSATVADYNADTKPDLAIVANGQVSVVLINATPGLPDNTDYFIHQHYLDFLAREPDVSGFNYWTDIIAQCGSNAGCLLDKRIGTSAAFLIESEFQQSGYFVYRLYNSAFSRRPSYSEFVVDRKRVVGGPELNASKTALTNAFVLRAGFKTAYPDSLSNTEFVNRLFDAANLVPFTAERQAAIAAMNGGANRATILREVADNATLVQREYNPAFVQMQYLGYLRRTEDQVGFQFWLDILNQRPNDFRRMVCAFITSEEYQRRFTNNITHSNAECSQ